MRYVEIETDLSLNLARLLILVSATTGNNPESILTLGRLVIYEFLARNPILLLKLLRQMGKKHKIEAREYEAGGLSSKYYNKSDIYSFESIRNLIQLLFVKNLVIINGLTQDQITISATGEGESFCSQLREDYYQRFFEIGGALKTLNSTSNAQLRSQINLLINA
jgi:hypothetical protein